MPNWILAGQDLTDSELNAIGTPNAGTGSVTPGTNFSVSSSSLWVTDGGAYQATCVIAYTAAATLTPSGTGFIAGAPVICTLPRGPQANLNVPCVTPSTWGMLIVNSSGQVQLRAIQSGGTVLQNDTISFGVSFPSFGP